MNPLLGLLGDGIPKIPLDQWASNVVTYITNNFAGFFDVVKAVISFLINILATILTGPPDLVMVAILGALAWYLAGWRVALFTVLGSLLIISIGLWQPAMQTLALVLSSAIVALIVGIPIGILAAQWRGVEAVVKPVLDVMQTMPSFVYLIPMVILLGLGNAPALIATVVFATPPAVRLTMLGIQQVPEETVEAAQAFGATSWQTLVKVQLPLALPTIMAGVNQVIMLALSMVVIAALIGAGGLGETVQTGLSQLNVGEGFIGGVGIVIIAIMLDRITRNVKKRDVRRWRSAFTARQG